MGVAVLLIAGGGGLVLVGCGSEGATTSSGQAGTDTAARQTTRASAPDAWPMRVSCPVQENSYNFEMEITNKLARPVDLAAGDIDCYDFSGEKTPPNVFNGVRLSAGETRHFTLRVRGNTERNWKMTFEVQKRRGSATDKYFLSDPVRVVNPKGLSIPQFYLPGERFYTYRIQIGANPGEIGDAMTEKQLEIPLDKPEIIIWTNGPEVRLLAYAPKGSNVG
jgi:hypothetical protein